MNNPFTSNRNIFNNIPKPNKTVQPQKTNNTSVPNINNNNSNTNNINTSSNQNIKSYTNLNSNTNLNTNINANNNTNTNTNSYSNLNMNANVMRKDNPVTVTNNNKIDLNFRGEFRNQSPYSSSNNINPTGFTDTKAQMQPQYQTKVISDKQFSSNHQSSINSSSIPSMTIQASNYNTNTNYLNSKVQGNSYQNSALGYNTNKIYQGDGYNSGVQRQKITFGIASVQQSDDKRLQYDPNRFVNRQQFINGGSSSSALTNSNPNAYSLSYKNNYHTLTNTNPNNPLISSTQQPQYVNQSSPPPKNIPNLTMSPIQQHSKHQFDQIGGQQLLDIDAIGDDIQKILASSKNQEQLCRLLGIQGNPHKNNINQQDFNNNIHTGYHRSLSQNPQTSSQSNSNPKINHQFSKKTSLPQNTPELLTKQYNPAPNYNNCNNNYYGQYQDQIQVEQYDKQKQSQNVFNYQSQNVYPTNPSKKINSNNNYGTTSANSINATNVQANIGANLQNNYNKNINTNTVGNINNNIPSSNQYISQLQASIDTEMKKLYLNGKTRVFLSATDRIETVKYNMEYI